MRADLVTGYISLLASKKRLHGVKEFARVGEWLVPRKAERSFRMAFGRCSNAKRKPPIKSVLRRPDKL